MPGAPVLERAGFLAVAVQLGAPALGRAGFLAVAVLPGAPVLERAGFLGAAASPDGPVERVACGCFEADSALMPELERAELEQSHWALRGWTGEQPEYWGAPAHSAALLVRARPAE
jgi:hypothetical protein